MSSKPFVYAGIILATCAAHAHAALPVTTVATFNGTNGSSPTGRLTLSADGSTLYGTTLRGGANNLGTVFSVPVSGGTPTVLASFGGANGANPYAGVTLSGNTLYGTTDQGGANGLGTVFAVPVGGGTPTVLASFSGGANGANPRSGLTFAGDTLYGTMSTGGANNLGMVYSVPVTGGTPTNFASFSGTNGANPTGDLILSGNLFYGATSSGGANAAGTVFAVPITGGTVVSLASFSDADIKLIGSLYLAGDKLYGATFSQAGFVHPIFSVPITGGTPTVLGSLLGVYIPIAGLTLVGDTLFGTGILGGADGGLLYSLPISGGTPTVLANLGGSPDRSSLTPVGNTLYGINPTGGDNHAGRIFSVTIPEPASFSYCWPSAPQASSFAVISRTR